MRVVSVDPAPKKDVVVFDGAFRRYAPGKLAAYCEELSHKDKDSVLLCWDAPLTGPPDADATTAEGSAYSQRVIEQFFAGKRGLKAPKGISVLPYSGCPHWTITRACIGLPRVGKFDLPHQELPFQIVHDAASIQEAGKWVVEIHPAVAIWLWCREEPAHRVGLLGL